MLYPREEFWEMLKGLKQQVSPFWFLRRMDEAGLCDRVGLMQGGKILIHRYPSGIVNSFLKTIIRRKNKYMLQLLDALKKMKKWKMRILWNSIM